MPQDTAPLAARRPAATSRAARYALAATSLVPALWLGWAWQNQLLGEEPAREFLQFSGSWTFNFLILTLCVSPLRALMQAAWLLRLRRTLGLATFFYASLHAFGLIGLTCDFSTEALAREITRHPGIAGGILAWCLLLPLAASSSNLAIRKLGGKRWQEWHRNVYFISLLGVAHAFMQSESLPLPLAYGILTGLLLGWRAWRKSQGYRPAPGELPAHPQVIRFHAAPPEKRPDQRLR